MTDFCTHFIRSGHTVYRLRTPIVGIDPSSTPPPWRGKLASGARGLILVGNARESHDSGPPVVTEVQLRDELDVAF
jgi:hypothetical protein